MTSIYTNKIKFYIHDKIYKINIIVLIKPMNYTYA